MWNKYPINETMRPCSQFLHSCICEEFIYSLNTVLLLKCSQIQFCYSMFTKYRPASQLSWPKQFKLSWWYFLVQVHMTWGYFPWKQCSLILCSIKHAKFPWSVHTGVGCPRNWFANSTEDGISCGSVTDFRGTPWIPWDFPHWISRNSAEILYLLCSEFSLLYGKQYVKS